jgi:hypothetical protein
MFIYAQSGNQSAPLWWAKYQYLLVHGGDVGTVSNSVTVGSNVDVSNECGPQSETYITLNPLRPSTLAGGSNEIFRDPMRGYFSSDSGSTWGGVDLPLPAAQGANGHRFGSDPSLAFDTQGNVFYSYIVVFFGNGNGVNGTELAVARSGDGGKTYPFVDFFSFSSGSNHFNDKPMITADTNARARSRIMCMLHGTPRAAALPAAGYASPGPPTMALLFRLRASTILRGRGG